MSGTATVEISEVASLEAAYREAFERWSAEVRRLQETAAGTDSDDPATRDALSKADDAQAEYRYSRDRLAECLLTPRRRW